MSSQFQAKKPNLPDSRLKNFIRVSAFALASLLGYEPNNINPLGVRSAMAQPVQLSPQEELSQNVDRAKNAFIDFIITGNPQSRQTVLSIRTANANNPDFASAFGSAMQTGVEANSRFSSMFESLRIAYSTNHNGNPPNLQNIFDALESVWRSATTGNQAQISQARRDFGDEFVNNALGFLAAREFNSLLSTADPSVRETNSTNLRNTVHSITNTNGSIPESFFTRFSSECSRDATSVLTGFAGVVRSRNNGAQRPLNGSELEQMAVEANSLYIALRIPGADIAQLNTAFGSEFVSPINTIVIRQSIPVATQLTSQVVSRRIDELENYLRSENLLGSGDGSPAALVASWRTDLTRVQNQDDLISLSSSVPSVETARDFVFLTRRAQRRIRDLFEEPSENYYVLSDRIFVARLRATAAIFTSSRTPLERSILSSMFPQTNAQSGRFTNLADSISDTNRFITDSLAAYDASVRSGQTDPNFLSNLSAQINQRIDSITASILGLESPPTNRDDANWILRRHQVARRLLIQYVRLPNETVDPVATLVSTYRQTQEPNFMQFVTAFRDQFPRYSAALDLEAPTDQGAILVNSSRRAIATALTGNIDQSSRTALGNFSPLLLRSIYGVLVSRYGSDAAAITALNDTNEMAKVCSLIYAFSTLPPAYGSYAVDRIGRALLSNYDDASIATIGQIITNASTIFITNGNYRLLDAYYTSLPDRLRRLFPDVGSTQRSLREGEAGRDVRVRTPNEDPDYAQLFLPSFNMYVRVPKRVYDFWRSPGGFLQVSQAPDLTVANVTPPNFNQTMNRFLERPLAEGRSNIPLPIFRLPLILQNAGVLLPSTLPPLGDHIADQLTASANTHYTRTTATPMGASPTTSETINGQGTATYNRTIEGGSLVGSATYRISRTTGATSLSTHFANVQVNNWRLSGGSGGTRGYNVNQALFELNATENASGTGNTYVDNMRALFSGIAPEGAETAVLFRYTGGQQALAAGTARLEAHLFQRFANGSFIEIDSRTLTRDEARTLYESNFQNSLQSLYGGTRVNSGNFMAQMDGCVLFASPLRADGSASDNPRFQGAGVAASQSGWGGAVDYEATRRGRVSGFFGNFNAQNRRYWFGRVSGSDVTQDTFGRQRMFGEFRYLALSQTGAEGGLEVRGYVAARTTRFSPEQAAALFNYVNRESPTLGLSAFGAGGGRIVRDTAGINADQDAVISSVDVLTGGRIYGISRDFLSAFVGGVLLREYERTLVTSNPSTTQQSPFGTDPNRSVTGNPNETVTTQNGTTTRTSPRSINQQLLSAAIRLQISRAVRTDMGVGYDLVNANQRGGFLNFEWTPSARFGLSLRAFAVSNNGEPLVLGGALGNVVLSSSDRLIAEGYVAANQNGVGGGAGEVRYRRRTPSLLGVDLALGGGILPDLASGGHGAIGIPLTRNVYLGAAGSYAVDRNVGSTSATLRTGEGILGVSYTLPTTPGDPDLHLANVSVFASGIAQTSTQNVPGEPPTTTSADAVQVDVGTTLRFVNAQNTFDATVGLQYWQSDRGSEFSAQRFSGVGSLRFQGRRWGTMIAPTASATFNIGARNNLTRGVESVETNFNVNLTAGVQW